MTSVSSIVNYKFIPIATDNLGFFIVNETEQAHLLAVAACHSRIKLKTTAFNNFQPRNVRLVP